MIMHGRTQGEALLRRVRRRQWPILITAVVLGTGMAFSLLWGPVVRHKDPWIYPGDIWSAYRSAHFVAWGSLGSVYAAGTSLVTFPGILLPFAPLALLTGGLGMTESFPYFIPHPTAWLLLGPYEILIGCTVLFACDALAERLKISAGRRVVLCVAEGVVLWPVLVEWGHPEDALALALAVYAMVFAFDNRWSGAGWLIGAAIATQPLILLMVPVLLAISGRRRAPALLVRSSLPAVFLLAVPLAAQFHETAHVLLSQPNFPRIDHTTPWTALAPRLGGAGRNVVVAAGPGRVVAVLAACALGWWARRWRDHPDLLVWAAAMALALRCFTESVMDNYYVWPTLALGLIVVARATRFRLTLGVLTAVAVTVSAQNGLGEWWWWWSAVTVGLLVILVSAFPARASRVRDEVPIVLNAAGIEPVHEHSRALAGAIR
jgi:hypothetical protein